MSTSSVTEPTPPSSEAGIRLRAAFVRRPHGVRGALRVSPLGGDASRFAAGLLLLAERDSRPLVVRAARALPDGDMLLELEGVDGWDAAAALRGAYLCVPEGARRPLGDLEWFVYQLVGLQARTLEGEPVGVVSDVEHYPAHEVLVVSAPGGDLRLPMVADFVREVDVVGGTITVTPWPEEPA